MPEFRTPELKPGERFDDLNCKGYRVIQDPDSFCFGMDAVLLANFAKIKRGAKVLDLCTGTGVIPILLAAKNNPARIDALELNPDSALRSKRSVYANGLEDLVYIICGDVCEASKIYGRDSMDAVTVNPPYMAADEGLLNPDDAKNMARHEITCTLEDVIRESAAVLREKGSFFMVHRPFRLVDIITTMKKYRLEPKRLRMVHSKLGKEATMVLIEGAKGGGSWLNVERPLIIYDENGNYTEDVPGDC